MEWNVNGSGSGSGSRCQGPFHLSHATNMQEANIGQTLGSIPVWQVWCVREKAIWQLLRRKPFNSNMWP